MTQDRDDEVFLYYRSPQDIRGESFTHRMRGLDEAEVREYLALLADQVQATEWQRHELSDEVERLRAEVERLRAVPPPAPQAEPQPAPSSAAAGAQAAAVLSHAQEVADQLVEEATRQAQSLIAAAQAQGREMVRRARDRAHGQLTAIFDSLDSEFDRIGQSVEPARDVVHAIPVMASQQRWDPLTAPNW